MTDNVLTITIAGKSEDIDVSAFLTIVKNTVALLRAIEANESHSPPRLRWLVTAASKNSPFKMRMAGVEERGVSGSVNVVSPFLTAMRALESGEGRPEGFTDLMLDRATSIVRPLNNSIARVVFADETRSEVVQVSQHTAANADRLRLPDNYTEFGELEGELGQITVHKPPYEFCIYDPVTDRRIPCHFDPDDLVIIRDYLKERIRVSGFVTYRRKDDAPVSVSVEDWLAIPRDENLPSIEDLHAARIDFTGGRKSEDVIADLRRPHG